MPTKYIPCFIVDQLVSVPDKCNCYEEWQVLFSVLKKLVYKVGRTNLKSRKFLEITIFYNNHPSFLMRVTLVSVPQTGVWSSIQVHCSHSCRQLTSRQRRGCTPRRSCSPVLSLYWYVMLFVLAIDVNVDVERIAHPSLA